MSKTWIAKCVSFKGKHPDGEVTHRVVVKAQYKKDGVELAKEELKLFDADHHDKYKAPYLTEVADEEEAEKIYIDYLAVREQLAQMETPMDESASNEFEKAEAALPPVAEAEAEEEFLAAGEELTATVATVAEYPLVDPYAVRLSIAKNNESFVHSMTLINTNNGASLVGQPDVFNPKPFSNIDNAVVYGLAMAIDAVNKYLVDFIDASQVERCVNILSGYAQDAEGNFMERYIGDHDLSNAQFMAEPKKKETPPAENKLTSDVERIVNAVSEREKLSVMVMAVIAKNFTELHDKYGTLPAAQIVEHVLSMANPSELLGLEECEEVVSHYAGRVAAVEAQEENTVQYYASQQWVHYVKEIMAQFEPPLMDESDINEAARNVGKVFNDWKIALFAEKDNYTTDAEIFKDEVYLNFESDDAAGALELLKSYDRTQSALCDVLADAYSEFIQAFANPKVTLELNNLVERLLVDESLKCTYDSSTVKALVYSELNANPVEDSMITNPQRKMQWWRNLSADFAKQQEARLNPKSGDYMMLAGSTEEINAQIEEIKAQKAEELDQAMAERVEEITQKSEEYDQEACVHGDGVTVEHKEPTKTVAGALQGAAKAMANFGKAIGTLPEEIAEPEITPDPMPAQEFYGDKLLSGEIDAPYQLAIAFMLEKHGAENYYNESEYQLASDYLRKAIAGLKEEMPALEPGLTVESMVKNKAWDADTIEEELLDKDALRQAAYDCAVFDYDNDALNLNHQQEAPTNEPETTRQDNEPLNDEPVTGPDNGAPVNDDVEPATQELTARGLLKLQMRAANSNIGAIGLGWGYDVVRQWVDENDSHCEISIWYRDKNGTKTKPMTFFGTARVKTSVDYVNDAMTLALINGLDLILFSLGVEVEG